MEETRRMGQHISDGGALAEPRSMRSSTTWLALLTRIDAHLLVVLVDGGILLSGSGGLHLKRSAATELRGKGIAAVGEEEDGQRSEGIGREDARSDWAKAARVSLRQSHFYMADVKDRNYPYGWRISTIRRQCKPKDVPAAVADVRARRRWGPHVAGSG
jgi:hypothetical protein